MTDISATVTARILRTTFGATEDSFSRVEAARELLSLIANGHEFVPYDTPTLIYLTSLILHEYDGLLSHER